MENVDWFHYSHLSTHNYDRSQFLNTFLQKKILEILTPHKQNPPCHCSVHRTQVEDMQIKFLISTLVAVGYLNFIFLKNSLRFK